MTPGNTCNPDRVVELHPNNNPAVLSGSGPCMSMGTAYTPISGFKMSRAEAKRSNLPLPDVPWDNEEIERIVSGDLYYGILKGPVYLRALGWPPLAFFDWAGIGYLSISNLDVQYFTQCLPFRHRGHRPQAG